MAMDVAIAHFQSESEAIATLSQMAVERWESQFGTQAYPSWEREMALNLLSVDGTGSDRYDATSFVPGVVRGDELAGATNVQTVGIDEGNNAEISNDGS